MLSMESHNHNSYNQFNVVASATNPLMMHSSGGYDPLSGGMPPNASMGPFRKESYLKSASPTFEDVVHADNLSILTNRNRNKTKPRVIDNAQISFSPKEN